MTVGFSDTLPIHEGVTVTADHFTMEHMTDLEVAVLTLELLYLSLVAGVLLAHEGDVVGGLLQDLRAGALVPVMHAGTGTLVKPKP